MALLVAEGLHKRFGAVVAAADIAPALGARGRVGPLEARRLSRRRERGLAVALVPVLLRVVARGALVLRLLVRGLPVALVLEALLVCLRMAADAALAAVVADVRVVLDDDGLVVGLVDVDDRHAAVRRVVAEVAAFPESAVIPIAGIAVAVIDAAVEPDVGAPIAAVPDVEARIPAPPARRPQQARLGRHHPRARHPVILVAVPRPVAGLPDVVRVRRDRLVIDQQRRRRDVDADEDAGRRARRHRCRRGQRRCEKRKPDGLHDGHLNGGSGIWTAPVPKLLQGTLTGA